MTKKFNGNKYFYHIIFEKTGKHYLFSFKAICKATMKSSSINNLNSISTELGIKPDNEKYYDSIWILDKQEAIKFFNIAKELLTDDSYKVHLEKSIDEDRNEGEWENITRI